MAALDPARIINRICRDIPESLREHIILTGSLAAAYEYRVELQSRPLHTKDADLVVHPADDAKSARQIADALLDLGWRPTDKCWPTPLRDPPEQLRAIRLMPPASTEYFIELLILPNEKQQIEKEWIPVKLRDGWYGLPSFQFMGLATIYPKTAKPGLQYAAPEMMAISNLVSYPHLTQRRIASGEFLGLRRCAKDLGRVIALASLAGRDATMAWVPKWRAGLEECFPKTWRDHARYAGGGLREMIADDEVMEEASKTTESGLLRGRDCDVEALRGFGRRLLVDAVEAIEQASME